MMMTLQQALAYYLTEPSRVPGDRADLIAAAKAAREWRRKGPEATATILKSLHDDHHLTYADIEHETGIDDATAQRLVTQLESGKWTS
jgi:hypothetical protein